MLCKNCGQQIDDKAAVCIHCGAKTKNFNKAMGKKPFFKKWWFWLIVALLGLYLIGRFSPDDPAGQDTTASTAESSAAEQTDSQDDTVPGTTLEETTEATTETPTTEAPTTLPEITVYKSGMYKVGSDIEPGEYFITCTKGWSSYVEVNSDSSGKFNSIVANENVTTFFFISVVDGQYLTVEDGTFVKAQDAEVPGCDSEGNYGEGMYRVGIDLPAGEYKVTPAPGDSTYFEVTSDCTGTFNSIVSNEYTDAPVYITVADGQYLKIEDGTFSQVE